MLLVNVLDTRLGFWINRNSLSNGFCFLLCTTKDWIFLNFLLIRWLIASPGTKIYYMFPIPVCLDRSYLMRMPMLKFMRFLFHFLPFPQRLLTLFLQKVSCLIMWRWKNGLTKPMWLNPLTKKNRMTRMIMMMMTTLVIKKGLMKKKTPIKMKKNQPLIREKTLLREWTLIYGWTSTFDSNLLLHPLPLLMMMYNVDQTLFLLKILSQWSKM